MENNKVARMFVTEVCRMAEELGLNVFVITDGASGTRNNGNDAISNARRAMVEWEKANGFDPNHDWSKTFEN